MDYRQLGYTDTLTVGARNPRLAPPRTHHAWWIVSMNHNDYTRVMCHGKKHCLTRLGLESNTAPEIIKLILGAMLWRRLSRLQLHILTIFASRRMS